MEYEGRICRAGSERGSFMLPTAVGCSYNSCLFCGLFKDLKYRELEISDIKKELDRVKALGANPAVVYLGDGNAFHQSFERLREICTMLHEYFPSLSEIRMDSTIPDIAKKSGEELEALAGLGVSRLYIGIETALPDVLLQMKKCHTVEMAIRETDRLHKAGIDFAAHVMFGIAGSGRAKENAEALASFVNRTHPVLTVNFSLFTGHLKNEIKAGRFIRATEEETLLEDRVFTSLVNIPMEYESYHDNYGEATKFHMKGSFPEDRDRFLKRLDSALSRVKPELRKTEQFITLMADLDDESHKRMSGWYENLRTSGFTGTQTHDIPYHITLASFPLEKEDEVKNEMRQLAERFAPISVNIGHIGLFPGGEVLFAAPDTNSPHLTELHNAIRTQSIDKYPWTPHVTILIDDPKTIGKALPVLQECFRPFSAKITRLHLCAFWPTREIASFDLTQPD